jgi:intraflagellar transport protein 122
VIEGHPDVRPDLLLPYARYLAAHDRFREAAAAFKEAGRGDEGARVLEALIRVSAASERYADAAYYLDHYAAERLASLPDPTRMKAADRRRLDQYVQLRADAETLYAYQVVHDAETESFRTSPPETLFNAARFVWGRLAGGGGGGANGVGSGSGPGSRVDPHGTSVTSGPSSWVTTTVRPSRVLLCLAKMSHLLGAYRVARSALERLHDLHLSAEDRSYVERTILELRALPLQDPDEMVPLCYQCMSPNPIVNPAGDFCVNCSAGFHRSFLTFEQLPLVEFLLAPGITDEEALPLLEAAPDEVAMLGRTERVEFGGQTMARHGLGSGGGGYEGRTDEGADMLQLEDEAAAGLAEVYGSHAAGTGPAGGFGRSDGSGGPPVVSRDELRKMARSEVLIRTWGTPNTPNQYFRVMDRDVPLCVGPCGHFFERDECELKVLEMGEMPYSRARLRPGSSLPRDRFHHADVLLNPEDEELGSTGKGVGGGSMRMKQETPGKGWNALKGWQGQRPSAMDVAGVVGKAQMHQEREDLAGLGVLPGAAMATVV